MTSLPFSQEQIDRFWANVDKTPRLGKGDCWFWMGRKCPKGYGKVDPKQWDGQQLAHRVAYWLIQGSLTPGLNVLHHCDNPSCVNAEKHLYEGTHADNGRDKATRGRASRLKGELSGTAKLTWEKVKDIRHKYNKQNISMLKLAKEYQVNKGTISSIIYNRQWQSDDYFPPIWDGQGDGKITIEQATEMRLMYANGEWILEDLGNKFGISKTEAARVIKNQVFKDSGYTAPKLSRPIYRGEENTSSKLTWEDVKQIRANFEDGKTVLSDVAKQYGVDPKVVALVIDNLSYVDLNYKAPNRKRAKRDTLKGVEEEIYRLHTEEGIKQKDLAERYGVSNARISTLISRLKNKQ